MSKSMISFQRHKDSSSQDLALIMSWLPDGVSIGSADTRRRKRMSRKVGTSKGVQNFGLEKLTSGDDAVPETMSTANADAVQVARELHLL